jgi:hypothetical protein
MAAPPPDHSLRARRVLERGSQEFLMVGLAATAALVAAVAPTAGTHLWRAQALVSILSGPATYVTLMSMW